MRISDTKLLLSTHVRLEEKYSENESCSSTAHMFGIIKINPKNILRFTKTIESRWR